MCLLNIFTKNIIFACLAVVLFSTQVSAECSWVSTKPLQLPVAGTEQVSCPYVEISFHAFHDAKYTRRPTSEEQCLPSQIYLDYGDRYNFTIEVTLNEFHRGRMEFDIRAQVTSSNYIDVEILSQLTFDDLYRVYQVVVSDIIQVGGRIALSGEDPYTASIEVIPQEYSSACDNFLAPSNTSHVLNVLTGCPPGRYIEFNRKLSKNKHDNCENPGNVPCFYFADEFFPVFSLVDTVSGTSTRFDEFYEFSIVGGGTSVETIERYNAENKIEYNSGGKAIWALLSEYNQSLVHPDKRAYVTKQGVPISWICGEGSPCAGVTPSNETSPVYYLLIYITSRNITISQNTYCEYSTEFVIQLHGLVMDTYDSVYLSFASAATLLLAIGAYFFYSRKQYTAYQHRIMNYKFEMKEKKRVHEFYTKARASRRASEEEKTR